MTIIKYTLLALAILILAACGGGGGGGSTTPTSRIATLKLGTSGTPSAQIAGVGITITLPDGVTPSLNGDGTVAVTVAAVSGVAAPGTVLTPAYTPAIGATKGTLRLGMASRIVAGFGSGEFVTVTLSVLAGLNPVQTDFILSGFNPIDINGNTATGLTAIISGYSLQ